MKRLRHLAWLALLLCGSAFAQQQQINCALNTPCDPVLGPIQTNRGDQPYQFAGKVNKNFTQLYGMFGSSSNLKTAGVLTASDVISLWSGVCTSSNWLRGDGQCTTPGGGGTVTSVALTVPAWLTVAGSPIVNSGTLAVTATGSQTANQFLATPNGSTGALGLRLIAPGDMPLGITAIPSAGQILAGNAGGTAYAAVSMSGDGTLASTGAITVTKTSGVAFATSATTDTTNASNIASGTLGAARMPLGLTATPSAGQVPVGNAGGTAYAATTMTGDATLASTGAITVTKTNGTAFSSLATATPGAGLAVASGVLNLNQTVNAQTGASYTIASTDAAKLVTFNNAGAVAVTLPQATGSFGSGFALDVENLGAGAVTITPTTSTINGAATLVITQNNGCSITSDGTNYQVSACTAVFKSEQTISFQPGLITAVTNTKGVFGKFVKPSTVDNIEASAVLFTCAANPTITLYECGTSSTCASPTTIGSATVTASGTVVDGTISSSQITAGDYVAWAISAGTCTSLDIAATAQVHSN